MSICCLVELNEIYIDYEKEEFRNKILSWINKTKNLGKTDRRKNNLN